MPATVEDIKRLKRIAPQGPYNDAELLDLFNAKGLNGAAAELWQTEVSATARLVDVSESGSSRKMSQAHERALAQFEYYSRLYEAELTPTAENGAVSRLIVR